MAYTRTYTIDASPSGDTVKAAIATKLDGDLTDIYTNLTSHEAMTTNAHGVGSGTIVGTATTDTLTNKTLSSPTLTGTLSGGTISGVTMTATITASGATIVSPTITGGSAVNMTIETPTLTGTLTLTSPTLTGTIDASGATISSPTITGATLSNPTLTGTITGGTSGGNNFMEFTNLNIAASVGSKALTVALKGVDGNNPAAGNKVIIPFRSATLTSGIITPVEVTGALSVVLSSGSTLGFTAAEAGRIYIWAINNAGTVELALSRTADIFPESNLVSTTAEGGAGAADSAAVMYSTSARTNVACRCLGYIEIVTGGTAGEWDNAPTKLQVMGPGVKRTGDIVQIQQAVFSSYQSFAVNTWTAITNLAVTITPKSVCNKVLLKAHVNMGMADANFGGLIAFAVGGTAISGAVGTTAGNRIAATGAGSTPTNTSATRVSADYLHSPASTSAQAYTVIGRFTGTNPGTINTLSTDADQVYTPRTISTLTAIEIEA